MSKAHLFLITNHNATHICIGMPNIKHSHILDPWSVKNIKCKNMPAKADHIRILKAISVTSLLLKYKKLVNNNVKAETGTAQTKANQ